MPLIVHSASGNIASGAEDSGNSIPNPGDGQSHGKLPPSTAATGNFITECSLEPAKWRQTLQSHSTKCSSASVPSQFSSSKHCIIARHTSANFSICNSSNQAFLRKTGITLGSRSLNTAGNPGNIYIFIRKRGGRRGGRGRTGRSYWFWITKLLVATRRTSVLTWSRTCLPTFNLTGNSNASLFQKQGWWPGKIPKKNLQNGYMMT